MHPSGPHFYFDISQNISATPKVLLTRSSILFEHFLKGLHCPLCASSSTTCERISQRVSSETGTFSFSLKYQFHVYVIKIKDATEKIVNRHWFFSFFAPFSHSTFFQTQTGVTVPLRLKVFISICVNMNVKKFRILW